MKSRSLGIIFIAAVIVPSILLAVLSIRSAGREEAYVEMQLATTLGAQVTHVADLANAEVGRVIEELRAGIDVPAGGDYRGILSKWRSSSPLVSVPFLLSPRSGVLWPRQGASLDAEQSRFLKENGDFLSDKVPTTVYEDIALRYQSLIMEETGLARKEEAPSAPAAKEEALPAVAEAQEAAVAEAQEAAATEAQEAAAADERADSSVSFSNASQMALDAFAQSESIQKKVYNEARSKGDQVSTRNVQPTADRDIAQPAAVMKANAQSAEAERVVDDAVPEDNAAPAGGAAAGATAETTQSRESTPPSRYVVTSRLLSQIASRGEAGVIPRFIGEKLVFIFWERQKDGRIAGCELSGERFRSRVTAVLPSTYRSGYVLTLLDEIGTPLATPPGLVINDWRKPFVSEPVGQSLPRWEAAAYLTDPDVFYAQARSSSLVIWIMVLILLVSVTGGGIMVLTSVRGEMKLAQKKATFVANVSHELKTPLTSIRLFVDLMRQKKPLPREKQEKYLSLMAAETERLTRLINNVLNFSASSARNGKDGGRRYAKGTIDAVQAVREVVEGQRVGLESRGFAVSGPSVRTPIMIVADPEALKQVLLNLLSNAEKYSPVDKTVQVEVEREGSAVLIHVRDRGIGVADKDRARIFDEFWRVDDSLSSGVQGAGLGLTIALRIARDHDGDISCAPREGGGSDFIVRLPARVTGARHDEEAT